MSVLIRAALLSVAGMWMLSELAAADDRVLFKSKSPDGSVAYGDTPASGSKSKTLRVESHPADEKAAAAAQQRLDRQRQAALAGFDERLQRAKALDALISEAQRELDAARANRGQAGELREGDRLGVRMTGQYAQRVGQASRREEAAVARLADLRQQRQAVAP